MKILAISGKAQSGKGTTVAKVMQMYEARGIHCREINFADKLKNVVSDLFRIERSLMDTTEGKQIVIQPFNLTVREILQKFGTELARNIYEDIWVWNLLQTIEEAKPYLGLLCVSDLRFPNEYEMMKDAGAILVRTVRPGYVIDQHNHTSETALDHIKEWHSVCRSSTVEGVEENAEKLAKLMLNDVQLELDEYDV